MTTDGVGYVEKAGGATRIPVAQQYASILKEGEIIVASIERLEGETLKLRTDDGMLLGALMQDDLGLMQGDTVETIVGKNDGRYLLYILNVSRAGVSTPADSPVQQASPGILSNMLATLKRNPGVDADTAMFLAENHIPDTAENVSALTQLSRGEGIGTLLGYILDSINMADEPSKVPTPAASETLQPEIFKSENPKSQDTTNKQVSTDTAVRMETGLKEAPATAMPHVDSAAVSEKNEGSPAGMPPEPQISATSLIENDTQMKNDTQPANSATLLDKSAGQPEPALPQDTSIPVKEGVAGALYGQDTATLAARSDVEAPARRVAETIRDITCQPEECTGGEIKKIVREIPRTLSLLKSQLVQSDMKHEGNCIKTVDEALRQTELADRTIHFEHMQLPLANKTGEYRTAELYVFRDRNKRKNTAEAGIAILMALDTKNIGRTETLIREAGGGISLEFRVESADTAKAFKSQTALLSQAVEAAGYRLTAIRFTGLERRTTVVNAGQAAGLNVGQVPKGVDVWI